MRNYKNLNEQITRIKSLFGDNRIHGNLIDEGIESSKPLLSEQGWKKRLLNQLKGVDVGSNVYKNIRKSLSSVDDIVSTKFLNYQVRNIGDMVRYIDEFESIWKASLGEQGFKRFKQTMDTLNDPVYVKKINDIFDASPEKGKDLYAMMRNNIPIETHDILDEMFPAALANKNLPSSVIVTNPKVTIVKDVKTNTNVVKTDVGNKYNKINDDGSIGDVTDVVLDNLKGKEGINTEYMFFSDDVKSFFDGSDKFPKTTTPKDVEVVVSRLKNKDIDYKTLDKHIEELGVKQWGGNSVENQIWREFKVGGVDVKFKFGTVGTLDVKPKFWEWDWSSDLKKDWGNSKSDIPFEEYASYWFKKYQKDGFLNTKDYKWDDYFQPFNVSAGVREIKYLPDGSKKS